MDLSEIISFFKFNSDTCSKTSGNLWQYCRDVLDDDITYSEPFKFKSKFANNNSNKGTSNVEIAVLLTNSESAQAQSQHLDDFIDPSFKKLIEVLCNHLKVMILF